MVLLFYIVELFRLLQIGELSKKSLRRVQPFDAIFNPADEQSEREIQEIAGLYRACPEQVRRLILASIRAMSYELMDTIIKE